MVRCGMYWDSGHFGVYKLISVMGVIDVPDVMAFFKLIMLDGLFPVFSFSHPWSRIAVVGKRWGVSFFNLPNNLWVAMECKPEEWFAEVSKPFGTVVVVGKQWRRFLTLWTRLCGLEQWPCGGRGKKCLERKVKKKAKGFFGDLTLISMDSLVNLRKTTKLSSHFGQILVTVY